MQHVLVGAMILAAAVYLVRRFLRRGKKNPAVSSCPGCFGCSASLERFGCSAPSDQPVLNQPRPK
ncbi:MAG TPA: FeoB-associated Cys-rich membrane protein [Thermoguttaceae bacterium]|nr:FeoB-associated Cys-rich membrane protein [Thermoguttaceae bacterium]